MLNQSTIESPDKCPDASGLLSGCCRYRVRINPDSLSGYAGICSYHRQLRKVTKAKSIFPTDDALLKMLYLATQDVLRKWTGRIQNWGQILLQLSIFFPDKVKAYLK